MPHLCKDNIAHAPSVALAPNCLHDLPDCVGHQLRLLHLDGMAAVGVTDVLRVENLG